MRVEITSSDYPDLQELHDWISRDPAIARRSEITFRSSGRDPDVQSALDVVDVVLSNATALAALAISFATWRQARRAGSATTFTAGPRRVTVTAEDADPAQKVIEALPADDQDPAAGPGAD